MIPRRHKRKITKKLLHELTWVLLFGLIAISVISSKAHAVQDETIGSIKLDDGAIFLYAEPCKEAPNMYQLNFVDFAMESHKGCWSKGKNYVHLWDIELNKTYHVDKQRVKFNKGLPK